MDPYIPEPYYTALVDRTILLAGEGTATLATVATASVQLQRESEDAGMTAPYKFFHRKHLQILYDVGARDPPTPAQYEYWKTQLEMAWDKWRQSPLPKPLPSVDYIFRKVIPDIAPWLPAEDHKQTLIDERQWQKLNPQ